MQSIKKEDSNPSNAPRTSLTFGTKPDYHPQQTEFIFDGLTIDSRFDSGNMANAAKETDNHYNIWIASDCAESNTETHHKTWFYFRVRNVKQSGTYTFTIKNTTAQLKLYNEGLLPVYKSLPSSPEWKKIRPQPLVIESTQRGLEISFNHNLEADDQETYFAFTYPWSYTEDQTMIDQYEKQLKGDSEIYFNRELLVHSCELRRVELLTISSHSNKTNQTEKSLPDLFPEKAKRPRAAIFAKKKYVLISSRVHPGETPASYMFNSFLKFLLSKTDARAKALRENFVFVLIPMLNPDGVYRGHYRTDTHGLNLNRFYLNPNIIDHPSIYATKEVILDLNLGGRLYLYCDLHAHAGKKGCFVFGNNMNFKQQVEAKTFAKLLALNSQYFEFDTSSFSEKNTQLTDKRDGEDKEGAGRVAIYKATNLVLCYTLECNYNSGKYRNTLLDLLENDPVENVQERERRAREEEKEAMSFGPRCNSPEKLPCFESYTASVFEEVGEAIGPALLDMLEANPLSRLPNPPYRNLKNLKLRIATTSMKDTPAKVTTSSTKKGTKSKENGTSSSKASKSAVSSTKTSGKDQKGKAQRK